MVAKRLAAREPGPQGEHVGVDDESRLVRISGRREQVREVDQVGLGLSDQLQPIGEVLVVGRALDRGDPGIIERPTRLHRELRDQPLVRRAVDQVRADARDGAQSIAKLVAELALHEANQEHREQDAEQRADPEERDRELASEAHVFTCDSGMILDRLRANNQDKGV